MITENPESTIEHPAAPGSAVVPPASCESDAPECAELTEQEKRDAWRMASVLLDHIGLTRERVKLFLRRREMPCPKCGRSSSSLDHRPSTAARRLGRPPKNSQPSTLNSQPH